MLERMIAHQVLQQLVRRGRLRVKYWDGSVRHYGDRLDTSAPLISVEITNPTLVRRLLVNASLAIGEGYANKQLLVSEDQLLYLFELILDNRPAAPLLQPFRRHPNHRRAQQSYIEAHYDVGNDYYDLFLDPTRLYSCAYFENADDSLEQAQRQKIDHLLCKLQLKPGMRLLDIGCGWGHLAVTAAKKYDVQVLGITLSEEQLKGAQELAEREGVSHLVTFKRKNYQKLKGVRFDRVVSVGMFEHVGRGNGDQYFRKVAKLLVPGGISVLHTITQQQPRPTNAWIDKHIFPGGYLPTVAEIEKGLARRGLVSVDRENLWEHYATTLHLWREAHRANRDKIVEMFDEWFYLTRDFWLAGCVINFRDGQLGLSQVVFTNGKPKPGVWPATRRFLYR
ncbi:MAG TPA: cyclopropane-fatty-acyl-phospholipid synthase family protein [Candidatus Saccharimonadales bacterium]|nr:cyclopropane-fatty-acyl-phospholipid synthase family protein [Candidatus Saccharimonadales bacterium]